ncbi:MAG: hypothetical protein P1U36_03150 [Legionellaceae bacterium]|nr:hypothetical protein [Legionellaceae bacterium]
MKKSALEQEIAALRQEVERLRDNKPHPETKTEAKPQPKHQHTVTLDKDAKEALTEFLVQAKKDYENLSPATTLCLFALGALFGRVLARGKGEH